MGVERGFSFEEISSWSYPQSLTVAKKLAPMLAEYRADDVIQAVFCINSWYLNRSAQEFSAALNAALIPIGEFGEKPIDTYDRFQAFYSTIEQFSVVSDFDDYVIPFMGQTKLPFDGKWRDAFYGCGMTQEYPRLCFSDYVCKASGREAEFEALLGYVGEMSSVLNGGGWDSSEQVRVALRLPSESHWECVQRWFASNPTHALPHEIIEELSQDITVVEKVHFKTVDGNTFPLFNPSLLHDYFYVCSQLVDLDEYSGIVDTALQMQVEESFGLVASAGEGCVAFPCFEIDGEFVENCPANILLYDGDGTAVVFYNLQHGDGNLSALKEIASRRTERMNIVEGIRRNGRRRAFAISNPSEIRLIFIAYVDNTAPEAVSFFVERSEVADKTCSAVDLMAIFQMASSVEEVAAYFTYLSTTRHRIVNMFSGVSDNFINWKESHRNIVQGSEDAESLISIFSDFNETDDYYRRFFSEQLVDYPIWKDSYVLGSPFSCVFNRDERGFLSVKSKSRNMHLGVVKRFEHEREGFIVICASQTDVSILTDQQIEEENHVYILLCDVFECVINSIEVEMGCFASCLEGPMCIEYVPACYGLTASFDLVDSRLGLKCAVAKCEIPLIKFTVDKSSFLQELAESSNRGVECDVVEGVLASFAKGNEEAWKELSFAFERIRPDGKMVDTMTLKIPYVWHSGPQIRETVVSRSAALKTVANAVSKVNISPEEYYGKAANKVLRCYQDNLTVAFKTELGKFDKRALVISLYEVLAESSHEFYLHTKRFVSFDDLDAQERDRFGNSTFALREDARRHIRAARYSIETILAFDLGGSAIPNGRDIAYVVSLANQLLSTCDDADMLFFEPKGFGVQIHDDFTITAIENEEFVSSSRLLKMRQLLDSGHVGGDVTDDPIYIQKAKAAFEQDVGISFNCFLSVLDLLALGVENGGWEKRILRNVIIAERASLEAFLFDQLGQMFDADELLACVDFLILDVQSLCTIEGRRFDYLPFGRMKDRPNRLELKPLVALDDELIFSPIEMGLLEERWVKGIAERFLPVKVSYPTLYNVMEQWKRLYEKALEKDTHDCFVEHGFNPCHVFKNLELHTRGDHPQQLGDYDVLAYDEPSETLWVMECKEFEKIEAYYDFMQLQRRWFGENGKLLKFERRISYVEEHIDQVKVDLGLPCEGKPKVLALLVCNKLFINMIGESNFDVVTLNELGALLSETIHGEER